MGPGKQLVPWQPLLFFEACVLPVFSGLVSPEFGIHSQRATVSVLLEHMGTLSHACWSDRSLVPNGFLNNGSASGAYLTLAGLNCGSKVLWFIYVIH